MRDIAAYELFANDKSRGPTVNRNVATKPTVSLRMSKEPVVISDESSDEEILGGEAEDAAAAKHDISEQGNWPITFLVLTLITFDRYKGLDSETGT